MFILLESLFYFSPFYKKFVLLTIIISSLSAALWLAIGYIIIKQNRNRKYSWNYLAKMIGKIIFPKNQDTALNAYQIESQIKRSQSKDLADNFIEKIAEKINDVSPDEIIDKSSLFNIKLITMIVMLTTIIILSISWEQSANAFYRWKNYDEQFLAPKPFRLHSQLTIDD